MEREVGYLGEFSQILGLSPGFLQHKLGMMSLHYIHVEPSYYSGSDLAGQASGVAWVEQRVGVVIG